jgi:hypothetical protein
VTETAPLVEMTVEGEQECDHVVEHVEEERHRPSSGWISTCSSCPSWTATRVIAASHTARGEWNTLRNSGILRGAVKRLARREGRTPCRGHPGRLRGPRPRHHPAHRPVRTRPPPLTSPPPAVDPQDPDDSIAERSRRTGYTRSRIQPARPARGGLRCTLCGSETGGSLHEVGSRRVARDGLVADRLAVGGRRSRVDPS